MASLGQYGDSTTTGIFNIGHAIVSVVNGEIIGRLTYPGPDSGNVSGQEGDCSAILAQMPWLVGGGAAGGGQAGDPTPKAQQDQNLAVKVAGYTKRWVDAQGGMQVRDDWTFVNADGTEGANIKTAAQKALKDALVTASAAAAILAK